MRGKVLIELPKHGQRRVLPVFKEIDRIHVEINILRGVLSPHDHEHDATLFNAQLEFAETVFFECPIHRGDYSGFEEAYEEMHRLAAAVGALIAPEEP